MVCKYLYKYLDGRLDWEDRRLFEDHLAHCPACLQQTSDWQQILTVAASLDNKDVGARVAPPSSLDVQRFETMARKRIEHLGRLSFLGRPLAVAIAAAVLLGIAIGVWKNEAPDTPHVAAPAAVSSRVAPHKSDTSGAPSQSLSEAPLVSPSATDVHFDTKVKELTGSETLHASAHNGQCAHMGPDTLCLFPKSRAEVMVSDKAHVVALQSGSAVFYVQPNETREFRVTTPLGTVVVVGTRFSVTVTPEHMLQVVVKKGTVRVEGDNEAAMVQKGAVARIVSEKSGIVTRLATWDELAAFSVLSKMIEEVPAKPLHLKSAKKPVVHDAHQLQDTAQAQSLKMLDTWRKEMIAGDVDGAIEGLLRYLQAHPNDVDARFLLATCHKRKGHPKEALALYQQLAQHQTLSVANRAAYLAGDVCIKQLSNPQCALQYFTPFLDHSGRDAPQRGEALYYKAEALLQLGQKKEATQILESVVHTFGRTGIGQRARNRLREIQP